MTITKVFNVKRAPFALGSLPTGIYLTVQEWICHMHGGAPRTTSFAILNTALGNCNQMMMPDVVNTLAAPNGTCGILYDCTHLIMQVVLSTTAVALHPDALQQHASTPIALHPLLEEDATNPLWLTVLFLSFSLHIMLLVLHKSGCICRIPRLKVDLTNGVHRGMEIGTCCRVLTGPAKLQIKDSLVKAAPTLGRLYHAETVAGRTGKAAPGNA
ncbi:hypothetical protein WJX82_000179 [Trebouxia sp. C0006]